MWRAIALVVVVFTLTGCSSDQTSPRRNFVNRVWRVERSSSVAPGTLYVFLSDGTLVITSSHGTPLVGAWKDQGGSLSMTEEGITYKVEILSLTPEEFRIRSHNPGEPVDIALVPADAPP